MHFRETKSLSAVFHIHAWVRWAGEIKYGLIAAARGALTF